MTVPRRPRTLAAGSGKNSPNLNPEFYEQIAPIYDELYADVDAEEAVRQWGVLVKKCAGLPKPAGVALPRLLDLGCGTGNYLVPWASAGFLVTGVDASPSMISRARLLGKATLRAGRIHLLRSDLRQPNPQLGKGGLFDIAVAHFNFFNLFPANEISVVLQRLAPYMQAGARLFTDCASPALMPASARDQIVLADGELVEIVTQPDPVSATVARSYGFRGSQITERYWLHSNSTLKAAANSAGWQLESQYGWTPDRARTPWHPLGKSANGHRVCVFRLI